MILYNFEILSFFHSFTVVCSISIIHQLRKISFSIFYVPQCIVWIHVKVSVSILFVFLTNIKLLFTLFTLFSSVFIRLFNYYYFDHCCFDYYSVHKFVPFFYLFFTCCSLFVVFIPFVALNGESLYHCRFDVHCIILIVSLFFLSFLYRNTNFIWQRREKFSMRKYFPKRNRVSIVYSHRCRVFCFLFLLLFHFFAHHHLKWVTIVLNRKAKQPVWMIFRSHNSCILSETISQTFFLYVYIYKYVFLSIAIRNEPKIKLKWNWAE